MTLTKNYQKLAETKLGNSYGDLYIRLYAMYTEQDEDNAKTKVYYQARAYFSGNSYILDGGGTGNVSGTGASTVNGDCKGNVTTSEVVIATTSGWVSHNEDGTGSITASAYLNYPNWGWSGTATATADLPLIDVGTIRLGANGTYKKCKAYLGVNGVWKKCKAYLGVNGTWKKGI